MLFWLGGFIGVMIGIVIGHILAKVTEVKNDPKPVDKGKLKGRMNWSKELPKITGWYLRANPPCPGFQKHYLQILDVDCGHVKKGEMGICWGHMMRVSDLPLFYWFGPIPKLPTLQLRENIGSKQ